MRVFLTGMMGSGKTAIGKALSEMSGYDLIDLDARIIEKYHKSIEDIFRNESEEAFRTYETETALALDMPENTIIATGGGFPLKEENRRWMKDTGKVIWLKSSPAVILERIKDEDRPLLPKPISVEQIENILKGRIPIYEQADIVIDTDQKPPEELAELIIKTLQ